MSKKIFCDKWEEDPLIKEIQLNEYPKRGYKEVQPEAPKREEMISIDGKQISKATVKEALRQFLDTL